MAIHTRTFTFAAGQEDWLPFNESPSTMGWSAGLIYNELAVGANDTQSNWALFTSMQQLGLPSEATGVNAIRVSFDYDLTLLNRGIAGSTSFDIESTNLPEEFSPTNLISVLRQTANTSETRTSSWVDLGLNTSSSIKLIVPIRLETSGANPAGNRFARVDLLEIRVEVDYEAPSQDLDVDLGNSGQTFISELQIELDTNISLVNTEQIFAAELEVDSNINVGLLNAAQSFVTELRIAVIQVAGNRFIGESTDTKPVNVPDGSLFDELDGDRDQYIFADGEWKKY